MRPKPAKVAILGTRYGNFDIEQRMLAPLRVRLVDGPGRSEAEIVATAAGARVIVCGGAPKITAGVLRRLPDLKAVIRSGIGVDSIDLAACARKGVQVANIPDYCVDEVATHALTLILAWARKLPVSQAQCREGKWELAPLKPLHSARDLVLGLLGFGRIAQSLCRKARFLGFQVWAHDPYVAQVVMIRKGARPATLTQLIRRADFVSLHLPLTRKTRGIINRVRLKEMKPSAYLINTARGELIDQPALCRALETGSIGGAALDVTEREPPGPDEPLLAMRRLVITPHCAWYTERSQERLRVQTCAEVIRVLRGRALRNLVDKALLG